MTMNIASVFVSQFVRTLFPSLSNASRVGAVALKNKDVPTVHQGTGFFSLQCAYMQDGTVALNMNCTIFSIAQALDA